MSILANNALQSADVADVAPKLVFANIGRNKGFDSYSFYQFADVAEVKKKNASINILFFSYE